MIVNAEPIWNRPGNRNVANHFVVVTGISPEAGVVHLNDSGIISGRDEQVPIATFEQAWAPNHRLFHDHEITATQPARIVLSLIGFKRRGVHADVIDGFLCDRSFGAGPRGN